MRGPVRKLSLNVNVFSKGKRKFYDCFAIEVRLKNRTLWGYRSTYPYGQGKGVPPAPGICFELAMVLHWVHIGCQSFESLYLQTSEVISEVVLCSPNMACPEQNVVLQTYQHQGAQQPEQFRIFHCLFINNINNAFIVSEEKHPCVSTCETKCRGHQQWEKTQES